MRLWDVFEHKGVVERLDHTSDGRWEGGGGGERERLKEPKTFPTVSLISCLDDYQ